MSLLVSTGSTNTDVRFAKPGYDVDDGDQHLVYNSKYPLLLIADQGAGSLSFSNGVDSSKSISIPHNLGYKPMYYVFCQSFGIDLDTLDTGYKKMSFSEEYSLDRLGIYYASADEDVIDIGITLNSPAAANITIGYFYVCYYNPIYETGGELGANSYLYNWGAKFTKKGKDAFVARKADRTFSSGDKSHQIEDAMKDLASGSIVHPAGRPVVVDGYLYDGTNVWKAPNENVSVSGNDATITWEFDTQRAYHVIFREGGVA